ncbi:hypothetical protein Riv7116_4941 [Rivularia sp. PCC 7116]|uniref:hypothetical protein n=1 Tax=Rivularia sp. PCC 7116 TaxID=373994 RepID=UPI00029F3D21|nr:hypothetical protein [Rivularia sp. PCC 7116]AFY57349.1 hypothetical protein Riv7116_4941 [Rivularia sp. PCC 7116]
MNKLIAGIAALALWTVSTGVANSQQVTRFKHQDDSYYHQRLNSKGIARYQYKIPANSFGVFTLKNHSRRSDFDIYVYDSSNGKLLTEGKSYGTKTELVITQPVGRDRYAYIKVLNYGSRTSRYKLYANYVNPGTKFLIAFAGIPFCSSARNINDRTSSRVITGISSMLQGSDFGGVARDVFINELTMEMRKQFGYGCMGEIAVNWVVSMAKGFYRNY